MSKHRVGFYHPFSFISFFAILALIVPYFLSPSLYWFVMWVSLGLFISAILFEMEYSTSNALLVVSTIALTAGTVLLQIESLMLPFAVDVPVWMVLAPSLLLLGFMKHIQQMGVFGGAMVVGIAFAASYGLQIMLASFVGLFAGLFALLLALRAMSTDSWNTQVSLGVTILILIIGAPAASWAIYALAPVNVAYIVMVSLGSMFGAAMCFFAIILPEPEEKGHRG